ncbi:MAG TPA: hypothetical protein ENN38_02435 [Actinobacteria bacterium]|nr:hypothetical protein [Actinomycetota bacterium]
MLDEDPAERHRKARIFLGRLTELQLAQWLELHGWTVSGLEARRQGPDIEACAADGRTAAFEVKFIGTNDADFAQIVESIAHRPAGGSVSLYDPVDYLLFRVYEAAKQLQKYQCDCIAVIIIEELTWSTRFALQVKQGWIDWANPSFFLKHDFEQFLQGQSCYPEILNNSELQSVLGNLTALWILTLSADFQYQCEFMYDLSE